MNTKTSAIVQRINDLLNRHETRLKSCKSTPRFSTYLSKPKKNGFEGTCDAVTDLLEQWEHALENRKAVCDDALFVIHQSIHQLLEAPLSDLEKTTFVKTLEDNKEILNDYRRYCRYLDLTFKSLIIEPAVTTLPDGERPDPYAFVVVVNPNPSLDANAANLIKTSWKQQIERLENAIHHPPTFKILNPNFDA